MIYDLRAKPGQMGAIDNDRDWQFAMVERLDKIIELLEGQNDNLRILLPTMQGEL